MSEVTYEIVEHDGGWAYKVDGVFSEPFPTHAAALAAAQAAAAEQEVPGDTEQIEFEDDKGKWHTETARGSDRPHTSIKKRTEAPAARTRIKDKDLACRSKPRRGGLPDADQTAGHSVPVFWATVSLLPLGLVALAGGISGRGKRAAQAPVPHSPSARVCLSWACCSKTFGTSAK